MKMISKLTAVMVLVAGLSGCRPSLADQWSLRGYSRLHETDGIYLFDQRAGSVDDMERLTPTNVDVGDYVWTRDGQKLIFYCLFEDKSDSICSVNRQGGDFSVLLPPEVDVNFQGSITVAPDGNRLLFEGLTTEGKAQYYLFDIERSSVELFPIDREQFVRVAWSPAGDVLALDGIEGIYVLHLLTQELRFLGHGGNPSWSPDGTKLFFSWLYIYDLNDGSLKSFDFEDVCNFGRGDWTSDSNKVMFFSECEIRDLHSGIYLLDIESGEIRKTHYWNNTIDIIDDPQRIP